MKTTYRGCSIDSHRAQAMGGWSEVYWSAFSSTGYEITSGFGGGNVRDCFQFMKASVDEYLEHQGKPQPEDDI